MANTNEQRRFDWGPPVQTGDSLKEWLIYLAIIVVIGLGTWLLLDVSVRKPKITKASKKSEEIIAVDQKLEAIVANDIQESSSTKEEKQPSLTTIQARPAENTNKHDKEFYVQIGAFADESSANEIFELLRKDNISAKLLKPDEQFEIFRLVAGPYENEKEAETRAEQLNEIGFPCFVVETQ